MRRLGWGLTGYLSGIGFPPVPWGSTNLQATPMHHRGEHLGNFFLSDKVDNEAFTSEDEEILMLFASQAATAIANARSHREVERARADLNALVDTSPVGVVVFDAQTGRVVSFNREAWRIVDGLRTPGLPREQILEVLSWRYADGREFSMKELPLPDHFEHARAMRAEEIVLSVPDGRSVRTLINATPIRSEGGDVVSVVVTMQDLAPLEALERQRAEFLEMVSHEMRAPLTSIKGSTATALGVVPIPPQTELIRFLRIIDAQADHLYGLIANLLDAGRIEAGTLTVAPEPSNVAVLVDRARNTFRAAGAAKPLRSTSRRTCRRRLAQTASASAGAWEPSLRMRRGRLPEPPRSGFNARPPVDSSNLGSGRGPRIPPHGPPAPLRRARRLAGRPCEGLTGGTGLARDCKVSRGARRTQSGRERGRGQGPRLHLHRSAGGGPASARRSARARPDGSGGTGRSPRILWWRRPETRPSSCGTSLSQGGATSPSRWPIRRGSPTSSTGNAPACSSWI